MAPATTFSIGMGVDADSLNIKNIEEIRYLGDDTGSGGDSGSGDSVGGGGDNVSGGSGGGDSVSGGGDSVSGGSDNTDPAATNDQTLGTKVWPLNEGFTDAPANASTVASRLPPKTATAWPRRPPQTIAA